MSNDVFSVLNRSVSDKDILIKRLSIARRIRNGNRIGNNGIVQIVGMFMR